jgi:hypothetical protein
MALISCPECKRRVSEKASQCPHCGCPIATATGTQKARPSGGDGGRIATAKGEQAPESGGWFRKTFGGCWTFVACTLVLLGIIGTVMKGCSEFTKTNKEIEDFKKKAEEGRKRQQEQNGNLNKDFERRQPQGK